MINPSKYIFQTFIRFNTYKFSFAPKQLIDNYWEMQQKVKRLSELIRAAEYPIVFTGAGISTSLGIPDYRSGRDTVIKTGTGLWNRQESQSKDKQQQIPIDKLVDLARPSFSHMCIQSFIKKGLVKHLISQNTDGLHLKSGVSLDNISELHGNRNLEFCTSCQKNYIRDFRTLRRDGKVYYPGEKRSHFTGRNCENCGGQLHDSIIYFGERLPRESLINAYAHADKADLCICVGSSLSVKPSSNIPKMVAQKTPSGKLCIINLQETSLDQFAEVRIHYFCDQVFQLLAKHLDVKIERVKIKHFITVEVVEVGVQSYLLILQGKDENQDNLAFIRKADLIVNGETNALQTRGHKCVGYVVQQDLQKEILIEIIHYDMQCTKVNIAPSSIKLGQQIAISYEPQSYRQCKQ